MVTWKFYPSQTRSWLHLATMNSSNHKYNNTIGDPIEHLVHIKSKSMLHARNRTLMYKVFPATLHNGGFRWFRGLELQSITFWSNYKSCL